MTENGKTETSMTRRERLRDIIRAEVAKAHPIEDARRPLELIVETSVRLAGGDEESVEIVDERGQLRNGVTLQDVIAELRVKHPMLFEPETGALDPSQPRSEFAAPSDPVSVVAAASDVRPTDPPVPRDWLIIGETAPAPGWYDEDGEPETDTSRTSIGDRLGLVGRSLGKRLRRGAGAIARPPHQGGDMFSAPRHGIARRPALAAGAGALALLAAVGIYAVATRSADTPTASPQPVAEAPDGPAANPDTASSNLARSDTVPLAREGADATDPVADAADSREPVASGADLPSTRATAVPAVGDGQTSPEASAESPSQDTADSSGTGAVPSGPAPGGAGPEAPSKLPLRGIPEVLDTATLWLSGQIVHLYGVEWVRGSGDPDDFTRYLKGREVACDPVENVDAYRCTVDGHDLSEVVLFNGGAKSAPNAPPELRAAEEKARVAKTGVWSR